MMDASDALAVLRRSIMDALNQVHEPGWCRNLHGLSEMTGLPRETLRGLIADMRADGLVEYEKGLWSEDGLPAGAGYCLSDVGRKCLSVIAEIEATP